MDRRRFLKTVGVSAGAAGVGIGVSPSGSTEQVASAAELDAAVELLTDEYGVSHVYGEDRYSVGYGQGYAQARDRLFQLDLMRLIGRGESAKLVGPSQLSSDIEVKRDLYTEAELETQWENATGENRAMIEGFADGISDRIAEMRAAGDLPGEFVLLGRDPEPWDPLDTVAVIAYFVGFFGVNGGSELENARTLVAMFDRFEDEATAWAAYHDVNHIDVPERHYGSLLETEVADLDQAVLEYESVPEEQFDAIEAARDTEPWGVDKETFDGIQDVFRVALGTLSGAKFGSNALVVGGEHTETGRPMLAGGPQMSLLKPPLVHEIGLHGAGFDVAGVGVVGAPGVIVGRTPEFAWTGTSARADMVDTVAVSLDPADHSRYEWDGDFHEFVTEKYVHRPNLWAGLVNGQTSPEHVEQEVAYVEQEDTRMPVVAVNHDEDVAFLKRTPTRMAELDSALDWLNVGRANDREEFEDALAEFPFGYNFLYVDDEDIGFYRTSSFAVRDNDGDPRFPMPQRHHEWSDVRRGRAVGAWQVNPERGYVVNWNNAPASGWRDPGGAFEWSGAHRVDVLDHRLRERIVETDDTVSTDAIEGDPLPEEVRGNLTLADVEDIIEDCGVQHPFAPQVVPHLVAAARASDDETLHAMADELEAWAGTDDVDQWTEPTFQRWAETTYSFRATESGRYENGGMAIYETVRAELNDLLYADTLGPQAPDIEFDPTAGDAMSGDVDPHVGSHGPVKTSTTLLINALEGNTNFDWIGDDSDGSRLVNAVTGEAMDHDVGGTRWHRLSNDGIRQDTWTDSGDQRWQTQSAQSGDSRTALFQETLRNAAARLEKRFDSEAPGEWRLENRLTEFGPLGGATADKLPMTNRASYQQVIAMHDDGATAKSLLPPGNSGHMDTWELLAAQFGDEPGRLTKQLDLYENFAYTAHPVQRERVEERAVDTTTKQ